MSDIKTLIDDDGRNCTGCNCYKAWHEFSKRKDMKSGYSSKCRVCLQQDQNERRRKKTIKDEAKAEQSGIDFDLANKFLLGGFRRVS